MNNIDTLCSYLKDNFDSKREFSPFVCQVMGGVITTLINQGAIVRKD